MSEPLAFLHLGKDFISQHAPHLQVTRIWTVVKCHKTLSYWHIFPHKAKHERHLLFRIDTLKVNHTFRISNILMYLRLGS